MLAVVALQCAPEVRLDLSTVSAPRPVLEIVLKGFGVKFPEKSAWLKLQHQLRPRCSQLPVLTFVSCDNVVSKRTRIAPQTYESGKIAKGRDRRGTSMSLFRAYHGPRSEETQISSCITTGFFREAQKESREICVAFVIGYRDGKPTTITNSRSN